MSTQQTAEDKLAEMFEKMIDDFCETHSPDEIEAMFAKCDDIFDGIEKRHKSAKSPEGVAAPLEPTRLNVRDFRAKWSKENIWIPTEENVADRMGTIASDYGQLIRREDAVLAIRKLME